METGHATSQQTGINWISGSRDLMIRISKSSICIVWNMVSFSLILRVVTVPVAVCSQCAGCAFLVSVLCMKRVVSVSVGNDPLLVCS